MKIFILQEASLDKVVSCWLHRTWKLCESKNSIRFHDLVRQIFDAIKDKHSVSYNIIARPYKEDTVIDLVLDGHHYSFFLDEGT